MTAADLDTIKETTRDDTHLVWICLGIITVIGAGLRIIHLGSELSWIDESYSWLYAQQSQSEIWTSARAHGETTPPLYYFILRLWLVFGHSEFALRSFSSLVGTLTIPVVFLIGRVFAGTRAGLIAALLLATSVTHVAFSQEARSYALLMLAASTAVWGVMLFLGSSRGGGSARAAKVPNGTTDSWNRLIGLGAYAVGTTIALYSHNTAVFLPLLANLVVICQRTECPGFRRRTALKWAAANVVPLVLWLWWVPVVLEQARSTENISWIAQPNPIRAAWEAISLYGPMCLPSGRPWSDLAKLALASLIPGLIAIGFWHWRDRRRWVCGLLTFVAGVPLGIWLFGLVARPIWLERGQSSGRLASASFSRRAGCSRRPHARSAPLFSAASLPAI